MFENKGVEDMSLEELEQMFNDIGTQTPPTAQPTSATDDLPIDDGNTAIDNKGETKAFAKRLSKKVAEERETIAKTMGFASYDEMIKSREKNVIAEKGLDPDQVTPVVDELVKQRIDNDPRIKELETIKRRQIEEFGKRELAEITKLTGGEITELSQLSDEVIDLWKQKGSLKSAYLAVEGEKLITKLRSEQSKGSTGHLVSPTSATGTPTTTRLLTAEEKRIWKLFNPNMSDEELNKKTTDNRRNNTNGTI